MADSDEEEFTPNATIAVYVAGEKTETVGEDYGDYAVIRANDAWGVISQYHHRGVSAYTSLKVARNFAQRLPIEYPDYDDVVDRALRGQAPLDWDRDYMAEVDLYKQHVTYCFPNGAHRILKRI